MNDPKSIGKTGQSPRNVKLVVAYDGTDYFGFQRQGDSSRPTIQGVLERGWRTLTGETIALIGAGRTDAGVHADGQVVNFRTENHAIPTERLPFAFNATLPPDVRIIASRDVSWEFHARFDAVSKLYEYRFFNDKFPLPRRERDTHFVSQPLDVEAMDWAAALFVGKHDFSAFTRVREKPLSAVRCIAHCTVRQRGRIVRISVEADGFLHHMVRTIAGTLLDVGRRKITPEDVRAILMSRDRRRAGRTLPGKALVLKTVRYERG